MQKLRNILGNRWVLAAIGLVLVALLIWFVGDAVAFYDHRPLASASARLGLILLIVLIWAATEGWKHYLAWRANRQVLQAISGGDSDNDASLSAAEVAELKRRFEQAASVLKSARFENRQEGTRQYLYQLPWYMFVGAPGSGKTTALIHSGLRFPLENAMGKDSVRGVGGTRNCDWWFTDEAVLLDTAGRYTTQTSNTAVDSAAWTGFIKLLKKFRPRQPINGVIVTLSIADLLTQTEDQRLLYARSVRQRIAELQTLLEVNFPIYILITKADLLAGFSEFFADLGRDERAQVWGATFGFQPGGNPTLIADFHKEFEALLQRLEARLATRLEDERDQQRRGRIYLFPQQVALLQPLISAFLDETFGRSAFQQATLLRGVYFSSGTQEGSPLDRVLSGAARTLGLQRQVLPPSASSGKSYFVTRLLREVIFAESDLTGQSEVMQRRQTLIRRGLLATALVFSIGLISLWTVSYFRNQTLIATVAEASRMLQPKVLALNGSGVTDVPSLLPTLNETRDLPGGYGHEADSVPLTLGAGLYQGTKLGAQASHVYLNLLHDTLLPPIVVQLEAQIRSAESAEERYEALKNYLSLYDDSHLDADSMKDWVLADWRKRYGTAVNESGWTDFEGHLTALFTLRPLSVQVPMDRPLVDQARAALATASLPERAYGRMKRIAASTPNTGKRFTLSDAAGPSAPLVFVRNSGAPITEAVPLLFTVEGYQSIMLPGTLNLVRQLSEEQNWVLGEKYAGQRVQPELDAVQDVKRLYFADYARTWDTLLNDLRVLPASTLDQTVQILAILDAPDSPIKQLLQGVRRETRIADAPVQTAAAGINKAVSKLGASLRGSYNQLTGQASPPGADAPEALLDKHFEALDALLGAPGAAPGTPAPIDGVLGKLKEYEVSLRAAQEALKLGNPAPADVGAIAKIKTDTAALPSPLPGLINSLINRSTGQAASLNQQGLQKTVAGGVGASCKQAVQARYPFARSAKQDIPLGDFTRLFGPNGEFDTLVKTKLQTAIDTSGPVWRAVNLAEGVISVAPETVHNLQQSSVIREAFFANNMPNPAFQADLVLIKLDEHFSEVQWQSDGQTVHMQGNGAARVVWPSLTPGNQVKLVALPTGGGAPVTLSADGPWGLFRLLDQASVEGGTPDRQRLAFQVDGRKLSFELRSPSVRTPFHLKELEQFHCPG